MEKTHQKAILITGASSGIGKALAVDYSKQAGVMLLLVGRNDKRLHEVKAECEANGAKVEVELASVADCKKIREIIVNWDKKYQIDIAIANAGVSGGTSIHRINEYDQFDDVVDTNIKGVFSTINPIIPLMIERKCGNIVLMSSMAGFVGMPTAVAYSVSKVSVKAYGDAIRPLLKPHGVKVSTIFPGFIKTPMTEVNDFEMPFLMEPEEASEVIIKGIEKGKASIAFPLPMYLICKALSRLPWFVRDFILTLAPNK